MVGRVHPAAARRLPRQCATEAGLPKFGYPSREAAHKAARRVRREEGGTALDAYRCGHCTRWHIGHGPERAEPVRAPARIQRKRLKGWTMPGGAIYVGRPTPWGNPLRVGDVVMSSTGVEVFVETIEIAIALYRYWAEDQLRAVPDWLEPLRGAKALVCWCDPDPATPCHVTAIIDLGRERGIWL